MQPLVMKINFKKLLDFHGLQIDLALITLCPPVSDSPPAARPAADQARAQQEAAAAALCSTRTTTTTSTAEERVPDRLLSLLRPPCTNKE